MRLYFGECDNPKDGLYQLQQSYVQETFNEKVPDRRGTSYGTIAGTDSENWGFLIDGQADGNVSVESVEYLRKTHQEHPGLHDPLGQFDVTHNGLLDSRNPPAPTSLCALYPSTCPGLGVVGAPQAGQAQASPSPDASGRSRSAASASSSIGSASTTPETGLLGNEPATTAAATVPANSSVDIALDFEAAPGALVVVFGDQIGTGLSAAFGGTPSQVAEMLGVPVLLADLDTRSTGLSM